ncbi:16S rRNA (guanine(966)-N(2))-methyltransferase RsmD [Methylophaga sulfidovorans]|uniref:Ribosomal RNA small subunit methyltransferase D n=1 Tax=Methylophaga sulfidovorans TaxID=45496 RepID=A0A1I3V096_9GAMM|nr:16S rRNA (guanine(966)-N(2))-methyltransferase RsmD [Methylophaga sulfidovorans]SFJ87597.1 16S rRNA m(2)G-966 methyltransferase [Methylophaga sulfidovorans]
MAKQNNKARTGALRIIGGIWRGRKLAFPEVEGLRPTSDRTRETVFNWLQPYIGGSRCLDLFAGSGALGFEAASRGAAEVVLIENNRQAFMQLKQNAEVLQTPNCHIENKSAEHAIGALNKTFDIVFIDPPYQADLWTKTASDLLSHNLLSDGAMIYLEYPAKQDRPDLPSAWYLLKEKKAGDVKYCLFEFHAGEDD